MIQVSQLSKCFGRVRALDAASFRLAAGESLVILGPSGSGKTTLLRLIAGLEMPDEGQVLIDGGLASRPGWVLDPHRRGIGFVFQTPCLWPHMTVAQNILFGLAHLSWRDARQRLDELLAQTELIGLERRYPSELSGGEARRVALARTLAPTPKCLLMDEPLTNLDQDLRAKLLTLIKETVQSEGSSLLYVTHDPDETAQISGRVLTLRDGRLCQTPEG